MLIQGYDTAIVSFLGEDGYPVSFPVKDFRAEAGKVLVNKPKGLHFNGEGQKACILLNIEVIHNDELDRKLSRYVRFRGYFSRAGADFLEFRPQGFYSFRMSGFLNFLRFIREGKKNAKKYLRERASS
ncbi:MAG: hypothetical protein ACE5KU_00410 [Nitrososphaerales archaeon]